MIEPMESIVIAVVATFFGIIVLAGGGYLYWDIRKGRARLVTSMDNMNLNLVLLVRKLDGMEPVPHYIDGLKKVCEAHVVQIERLRASVDKFHGTIFAADEKEREKRGFIEYREDRAADEWEINELVSQGIPRAEAEERVQSASRREPRFRLG